MLKTQICVTRPQCVKTSNITLDPVTKIIVHFYIDFTSRFLKQIWLFPCPYGFCNLVQIHRMKINDMIWGSDEGIKAFPMFLAWKLYRLFLYCIVLYSTLLCCTILYCILKRDNNGINIIYSRMNQQPTTHWHYNSTYRFPFVGRMYSKHIQYSVFTRFSILDKGMAVWNLNSEEVWMSICACFNALT